MGDGAVLAGQTRRDDTHIDWRELMGDLRGGVPDMMKGFAAMAQAATGAGALDTKTRS
jgi:hypothetical protein